jgi:hypothetical protein
MSGRLDGTLDVDGETLSFANGTGYHDHNWGFWQGVSWQWGQAQQGDLSLLYGGCFPRPRLPTPTAFPALSACSDPMARLVMPRTSRSRKPTAPTVSQDDFDQRTEPGARHPRAL